MVWLQADFSGLVLCIWSCDSRALMYYAGPANPPVLQDSFWFARSYNYDWIMGNWEPARNFEMLLMAQSRRNLRNKKLFVLEFIRPKMHEVPEFSPRGNRKQFGTPVAWSNCKGWQTRGEWSLRLISPCNKWRGQVPLCELAIPFLLQNLVAGTNLLITYFSWFIFTCWPCHVKFERAY